MVPVASPPRSPLKPVDRELLRVPVRDDERPSELGTPLVMEESLLASLFIEFSYPNCKSSTVRTFHKLI